MTLPPPPPPPPPPTPPPPPPPPPAGGQTWVRKVIRAVVLGVATGVAFIVGLAYFVSGSVGPKPEAADVCVRVPSSQIDLIRDGVTVETYCDDIDVRLDIPLGGVDGFEGDFSAPDAPGGPAQQRPAYMVWESDGCSAPVLGSGPFDFTLACNRHDFGWRNLKELDGGQVPVWVVDNKDRADAGFLYDMRVRCSGVSWVWQWACDTTARVYYSAVRLNPSGVAGG